MDKNPAPKDPQITRIPDNDPIAYFRNGGVVCKDCLAKSDPTQMPGIKYPVRVYAINIHPYTQTCHKCDKVVYQGTIDLVLYDKKGER